MFALGEEVAEPQVVVAMHMADEDAAQVAQDLPRAARGVAVIAVHARELPPGTLAAIEQQAPSARDADQRACNWRLDETVDEAACTNDDKPLRYRVGVALLVPRGTTSTLSPGRGVRAAFPACVTLARALLIAPRRCWGSQMGRSASETNSILSDPFASGSKQGSFGGLTSTTQCLYRRCDRSGRPGTATRRVRTNMDGSERGVHVRSRRGPFAHLGSGNMCGSSWFRTSWLCVTLVKTMGSSACSRDEMTCYTT